MNENEMNKFSKTGIVIEGGGHRGIYAAGVLDVLLENNLIFDGVIGVSAGAIHGASYVAKQAGRSIRYTKKYCADKRYRSFASWLFTGNLFNVNFCYKTLPEKLDPFNHDAFEMSPVDFFVTCTNVKTGEAVYHKCKTLRGEEMKWLQASASMPLASLIVNIGSEKFLDGGIADSVPLFAMQKLGFKKNLVILTQCKNYEKKKNSLLPVVKLTMKKYPEFVKTMEERHLVYNATLQKIEDEEKNGSIVVLRPSENLSVSRTEKDAKKIQALYDLGRNDSLLQLEKIKMLLKK